MTRARTAASTATLALFLATLSPQAFGWGELGHHLIGRTAAKIVRFHPRLDRKTHAAGPDEAARIASFVGVFKSRWLEEGHISNIPDIYWRSLDGNLGEDANLLSDSSHFLNAERYLSITPATICSADDYLKLQIPLGYAQASAAYSAKVANHDYFHSGTLPWRAQQLATLYYWTLNHYQELAAARTQAQAQHKTDRNVVVPPSPGVTMLTYAGLLSHMTSDSSQPYHVTSDYDGTEIGHKGIHSFLETTLVNALEDDGLAEEVQKRAKQLLVADGSHSLSVAHFRKLVEKYYPGASTDGALVGDSLGGLTPIGSDVPADNRNGDPMKNGVAALTLALIADSYATISKLQALDTKFAIATLAEAKDLDACKSSPMVKQLLAQFSKATTPVEKTKLLATKVLSITPSTSTSTSTSAGHPRVVAACRRSPFANVDDNGELDPALQAPTLIKRFRPLLIDRLAVATALSADIWVRLSVQAGEPKIDFSFEYALKPAFVSPTDPKCAGYATKEDSTHFLDSKGLSVLPYKKSAKRTQDCMSF